jgi:hypothetical protein
MNATRPDWHAQHLLAISRLVKERDVKKRDARSNPFRIGEHATAPYFTNRAGAPRHPRLRRGR